LAWAIRATHPRAGEERITTMTPGTDRARPLYGALAGLLTGAVAVGVGQFVASLGAQNSSPLVAVGDASIGLAPEPVKNFAISEFGSHDKTVLLIGIGVVLAVFAAVIGILGTRRLAYGLAGLGVFTAIGLSAAGTRPGADAGYYVPTLVAAAAGAVTLILLLRAIPGSQARAGQEQATGTAGAAGIAGAPGATSTAGAAGATSTAGAPGATSTVGAADQDRRRFLVTSAAAAGAAVVAGLGGRVLAERGAVTQARSSLRLPRAAQMVAADLPPGADFRIPGLSPFVTPNGSFYRVDTALILPQVPPDSWTLRIHGMVEREIELSFGELLRRPLIETFVTLTCVSDPVEGPYVGNARWLGASLASLIREARPRAGADQILSTSTDGFTCGTPVQTVLDGRHALLAVAMNGQPLPVAHGFPARMVVPGLYGYVSATKWVTDIKLTTFAAETAYWAQRGWAPQATIKTESRIDVPASGATQRPGRIPVAGVAWAQHRGIDAVHVRVDRGPWNQATLAAVPGIDTWRQWRWYWDATPGTHVIEARATDGTGHTQTSFAAPPEPNGASGYPSTQVTIS
jgi:DMSO/TMAO reductase YedYZ molybdopterin-dependent catalytic subunit